MTPYEEGVEDYNNDQPMRYTYKDFRYKNYCAGRMAAFFKREPGMSQREMVL